MGPDIFILLLPIAIVGAIIWGAVKFAARHNKTKI